MAEKEIITDGGELTMKKMRRLAAVLVLIAMTAAMFAPAALADTLYGVIKTPSRDGSVNLRAKAGVSQAIIGWAKNGDEVEVVYEGNTWHRVQLIKNGKTGWIYGRYLRITDSVSSGSPTGVRVSGSVAQIMTKYPNSTVNLRRGAGTKYSVVGEYGRGTRMEILDESGNWYKVQFAGSGKEGWISKNYVSLGLEARTTGRVNLRRGAGTGYTVLRTLKNGQSVTVTWVGEKWSKVEVGGESGYISNSYYTFK